MTFDRDFEAVIAGCAGRREGRWHLTWITPRIMRVYAEAFDAGHAHSFEVWNEAGKLVGGGYGLASGASFTSESQFALESNASRIGMTVLNWHLAHWGFRFNDGKLIGPLWQNMGFREIPRRDFLARLADAVRQAVPGDRGRLAAPGRWPLRSRAAKPTPPAVPEAMRSRSATRRACGTGQRAMVAQRVRPKRRAPARV